MLTSHAMDTAQITGCKKRGACRIVDTQFTVVKWALLQRNFFWKTGVGGIKLQVKEVTEKRWKVRDVEFSCKTCYVLCTSTF